MKKYLIFFFFSPLFFACSLKYNEVTSVESNAPELQFTDLTMKRFEDNKETVNLKANSLEEYPSGGGTWAKGAQFSLLSDGKVTTEGSAGSLSAVDDVYTLHNLKAKRSEDELTLTAKNLRFDKSTQQVVAGRNDIVTIEKGKTKMSGSGFSASGISKKFSFTGSIEGVTVTDGDDAQNPDGPNDSKKVIPPLSQPPDVTP